MPGDLPPGFLSLIICCRRFFFWILAYALLAILAHLVLISAGPILTGNQPESCPRHCIILWVFYRHSIRLCGRLFEKKFYNRALGIIILSKAVISLIVFIILISVVR
jgi:hypothetical protein